MVFPSELERAFHLQAKTRDLLNQNLESRTALAFDFLARVVELAKKGNQVRARALLRSVAITHQQLAQMNRNPALQADGWDRKLSRLSLAIAGVKVIIDSNLSLNRRAA